MSSKYTVDVIQAPPPKTLLIGPYSFYIPTHTPVNVTDAGICGTGAKDSILTDVIASINLPVGTTVRSIDVLYTHKYGEGGTFYQISAGWYRVHHVPGRILHTPYTLVSAESNLTGHGENARLELKQELPVVLEADNNYFVRVRLTNSATCVHGLEVHY